MALLVAVEVGKMGRIVFKRDTQRFSAVAQLAEHQHAALFKVDPMGADKADDSCNARVEVARDLLGSKTNMRANRVVIGTDLS